MATTCFDPKVWRPGSDEFDWYRRLDCKGYGRVKTPIGALLHGGRSGAGNGWYFYPNDLGATLIGDAHVKSFGRHGDAVSFIKGIWAQYERTLDHEAPQKPR